MVISAVANAVANLVVLLLLPFGGYYLFHRWKYRRSFGEVARRAGLQLGEAKYIAYGGGMGLLVALALAIFLRDPEPLTREGSAMSAYAGLGLAPEVVLVALIYGVVKTGFCEELLFRGLIAGSLGRRLRLPWANLWQALIFLLPHLALLVFAPELWPLLLLVFAFGLFKGWLRIRSESIVGPWLLHAIGNVTAVLLVATRGVPT
ncbi:MAG: CPBP family intramembrane glutamic endopeptidase [Acidobacteriota bacterium]